MPWFEIYGKHFLTFNPRCDEEVSPLPPSETEPIDEEFEEDSEVPEVPEEEVPEDE